jgi:endonuclease III
MPEMKKLIRAWNKLADSDRAKIEYTMKPVLDLPGVGGLVALELAAKLGIFLVKNGVKKL